MYLKRESSCSGNWKSFSIFKATIFHLRVVLINRFFVVSILSTISDTQVWETIAVMLAIINILLLVSLILISVSNKIASRYDGFRSMTARDILSWDRIYDSQWKVDWSTFCSELSRNCVLYRFSWLWATAPTILLNFSNLSMCIKGHN